MIFSRPYLLYLLPLALLPLLIYWLLALRGGGVSFSAVFLVRRAYAEGLLKWRLRRFLILSARCLAVAFLISALARPLISVSGKDGDSGVPLRLVVLADNSYSMSAQSAGKPALSVASEAGLRILSRLSAGDKVAVSAMGSASRLAWSPDRESARASLLAIKESSGGTDYAAALSSAYEFLGREKEGRKAVLLLTDSAAHGMRGRSGGWEKSLKGYDASVFLAAAVPASPAGNAWAKECSASGGSLLEGRGFSGLSIECSAERQGTVSPSMLLDIPGHQKAPVALSFTGSYARVSWPLGTAEGPVYGRAALSPDPLAADNVRYFAFMPPSPKKMLCLYSDPAYVRRGRAGNFLQGVIGSGAGVTSISCDFADIGAINSYDMSRYGGIVLGGFKSVGQQEAAALERFVSQGASTLLIPEAYTEPGGLRFLDRILPADMGGLSAEKGRLSPKNTASWSGYELDKAEVRGFFKALPRPGAKVDWTIKTSRGDFPALISGSVGAGRVFLWTPGLETAWTPFALKPVFAPWMASLAAEMLKTSLEVADNSIIAGGRFSAELPQSVQAQYADVVSPAGERTRIPVERGRYVSPVSEQPGVYSVFAAGREINRYAVNLNPSQGESDLSRADGAPWREIAVDGKEDEAFFNALGGEDLAPVFVLLALLLLAGEFWLSKS